MKTFPSYIDVDDPTKLFGKGSTLYIVLSWAMYRDINVHRDVDSYALDVIEKDFKHCWPAIG